MSLRAIKTQARQDLHQAMQVFAHYYPPASMVKTDCHVRVHTKFDAKLGDLKGTNLSYAEIEAQVPQIVFMRSEVEPASKGVVMISSEEGYIVDHLKEPDGLTRTVSVKLMNATQRAAYPAPGSV